MRTLLALCLLIVAATAMPPEPARPSDKDAEHLAALTGDAVAARDAAVRLFLRRGTPALPLLAGAAEATKDPKAKALLLDLAAKVRAREPHGLRFRVGLPKMKLTLDTVRSENFAYTVTVENRGDQPVVLLPYLTPQVIDSEGNEVKPSSRRGRWGRRRGDHVLGDVKFVTIQPGKRWVFQEQLARYMHDPAVITGWKLPAAGDYTLVFTYAFDRATWKKRGKQDWKPLNDAKQPWNLAPEFTHTFKIALRVAP